MIRHRLLVTLIITGASILSGCQNSLLELRNQTEPQTDLIDNPNISLPTLENIEKKDLINYSWELVNALDANNNPLSRLNSIKHHIYLSFFDDNGLDSVYFGLGCNSIGGDYTLSNDRLIISNIMSTEIGCELYEVEQFLARTMEGRSELSYLASAKPLLTQKTSEGNTLVWQGSLTPEVKYGQVGDIVYWEINNQEPVCPDGTIEGCLEVRPVYYDFKGMKTGVGAWHLFVDDIEGYTHDSNLNRIIRLKRFSVDPIDVKGKQYVYVLDGIIESSIVN